MSSPSKCPVQHGQSTSTDTCPVDHTQKSSWSRFLPFSTRTSTTTKLDTFSSTPTTTDTPNLSTSRETSSIPRLSDGNWVYPSEAQFFAAMARKNHNPHAPDMKTIVPIHNAVNERAWAEIVRWETGRGGDCCGGIKLVNFKGRPGERSPKAMWKTLLGYSPPFDRHDWIVDRCGTRLRYIIDFYTGRGEGSSTTPHGVSFYLDVRPALDSWEAIRMRSDFFCSKWFGKLRDMIAPPSHTASRPS